MTACPVPQEIARYRAGELETEGERLAIEEHLDVCAACRETLAAAIIAAPSAPEELLTAPTEAPPCLEPAAEWPIPSERPADRIRASRRRRWSWRRRWEPWSPIREWCVHWTSAIRFCSRSRARRNSGPWRTGLNRAGLQKQVEQSAQVRADQEARLAKVGRPCPRSRNAARASAPRASLAEPSSALGEFLVVDTPTLETCLHRLQPLPCINLPPKRHRYAPPIPRKETESQFDWASLLTACIARVILLFYEYYTYLGFSRTHRAFGAGMYGGAVTRRVFGGERKNL